MSFALPIFAAKVSAKSNKERMYCVDCGSENCIYTSFFEYIGLVTGLVTKKVILIGLHLPYFGTTCPMASTQRYLVHQGRHSWGCLRLLTLSD